MKKCFTLFIVTIFIVSFSSTNSYCGYVQKGRKYYRGLLLLLCGAAAAGYGFSMKEEKVDISNPQINYSNWSWTKEQAGVGYPWYVDSNGIIKNTGNVALKDIKIYTTYLDSSGGSIAYGYTYPDVYWLKPLPVTQDVTCNDKREAVVNNKKASQKQRRH